MVSLFGFMCSCFPHDMRMDVEKYSPLLQKNAMHIKDTRINQLPRQDKEVFHS
jgi:hypothetical protein